MDRAELVEYLRDLNQRFPNPALKNVLQELLAGKSLAQVNPGFLKLALQFIQQQPNLPQDKSAQTAINALADPQAPLAVNPNAPKPGNQQGIPNNTSQTPTPLSTTLKPPGSVR